MKDMTRLSLVVLLLVGGALPARGASEICRFRALDAENPFRRWLGAQEVTCVAAGSPLDFPAGMWNVFARAEGAVSATPVLVDGDAAPASIAPDLVAGATVTPLLPEGRGGVIYAPRRGSAFPVDRPRVTVPADEPLWLFVLEQSTPVAVLSIAPLAAGTERSVDGRSEGPATVVGWLQVQEAEREALQTASAVIAPVVRAGSREADPLPKPTLLHGAFFLVTNVPAGNAELRLEGRGWVADRRVVHVQRGVTVAPVPLFVRATGTLTVHWNTDQDLVALDRSVGSCDATIEVPRLTITLAKCPTSRPGPRFDPAECTPLREERTSDFSGSMTFEDVAPGLYRADLRYGKLAPTTAMGSVAPLRVSDARIFASYFSVYGSLTRGGKPLGEEARVQFPGGVGFAPAEEEYRGVLRAAMLGTDTQIIVAACDGAPRTVVLGDQPIRPSGRFDIDIPANELVVHVNDTFTRESLAGATVKLESRSISQPPRVVFDATDKTDEQGRVVWSGVPVRETFLTVSRAGYEKRRVDAFTMPRSGPHTLDVQLVPLRGTQGRIVSGRPFDGGVVVWYSPTGSETERTDLAPDGTFVHGNRHTADETLAVVSASHPLWVRRSPATDGREGITLRFPDETPAVAFDVWLGATAPPRESRHVGVIIGGVRVPQPVLSQHQTLRRDPPLLRGSGPQSFRDLLATGPIDVLLGPADEEVATRTRTLDFFALPQFADVPRQRLQPGAADVLFPARP